MDFACLNNSGLYQHWLLQNRDNLNHFKTTVNRKIIEKYKVESKEDVDGNNKCYNYRMFKREPQMEKIFALVSGTT